MAGEADGERRRSGVVNLEEWFGVSKHGEDNLDEYFRYLLPHPPDFSLAWPARAGLSFYFYFLAFLYERMCGGEKNAIPNLKSWQVSKFKFELPTQEESSLAMASPVKPGILKAKSSAISPSNSSSKPSKLKSPESKDTSKDTGGSDHEDGHSTSSDSSDPDSDSDSDSDPVSLQSTEYYFWDPMGTRRRSVIERRKSGEGEEARRGTLTIGPKSSTSLMTRPPPTATPTIGKTQHHDPEPRTEPGPDILPAIFPLPPDFKPLQTTSSTSTSPFAKTNLSGKNLWLITCPSHIPLSSLSGTRVPFSQLTTGEPFLEHEGLKYGLCPNSDNSDGSGVGMNLLVPLPGTTTDGSYRVSNVRFQRALRLTAAPPALLQNDSEKAVKGPQKKHVHTQPEGLLMRYQPFGAGPTLPGGNIFGGDSEFGVNVMELENINAHVDATADLTPRRKSRRMEKQREDGERRKRDQKEKLNGGRGKKRHKRRKMKMNEITHDS